MCSITGYIFAAIQIVLLVALLGCLGMMGTLMYKLLKNF